VSLARRLLVPLLLLFIALVSWLVHANEPPTRSVAASDQTRVGDGWVEEQQGFRVLHLSGSPYELGYQHGILLGDLIRARISDGLVGGIVQEGQVSHFLLLRHAHQAEAGVRPEYREEMAGVADGAGVSYSDVLVLNTYDDLIARPWPDESIQDLLLSLSPTFMPHIGPPGSLDGNGREGLGTASGAVPDSRVRAAFAVFGAATRDGSLLQAVEFGPATPRPEELVMRVYQPEEGDGFVCMGPPGAVGCEVGLNEEQISVTALASPSGDSSLDGVPLPFVLRDVLQNAGDIPGALTILAGEVRTTGHNVLLGDGKRPDAQAVEFSQHLYSVFEAQDDFVARTNHFLDEGLAETQRSLSWWQGDESWGQLEELLQALESDYGRLDSAGAKRLVRQIAMHAEGAPGRANEPGVLGVVLIPGDLEMTLVTGSSGNEGVVVSLEESP
jgi:hypothetical protein